MSEQLGTGGLILNEPLLWHKGMKGRMGMSIADSDVPAASIDAHLLTVCRCNRSCRATRTRARGRGDSA